MYGYTCQSTILLLFLLFIFIFYIYKLIYKAPEGRNFRGAVSSQRWPKTISGTHDIYSRRDGQAE